MTVRRTRSTGEWTCVRVARWLGWVLGFRSDGDAFPSIFASYARHWLTLKWVGAF